MPKPPGSIAEVKEVIRLSQAKVMQKDIAYLDTYHPDCTYIDSKYPVMLRLPELRAGSIAIFDAIDTYEIRMDEYLDEFESGDIVMVAYVFTATVVFKDGRRSVDQYRVTLIAQKEHGDWLIRHLNENIHTP